jgi:hypothetical protein
MFSRKFSIILFFLSILGAFNSPADENISTGIGPGRGSSSLPVVFVIPGFNGSGFSWSGGMSNAQSTALGWARIQATENYVHQRNADLETALQIFRTGFRYGGVTAEQDATFIGSLDSCVRSAQQEVAAADKAISDEFWPVKNQNAGPGASPMYYRWQDCLQELAGARSRLSQIQNYVDQWKQSLAQYAAEHSLVSRQQQQFGTRVLQTVESLDGKITAELHDPEVKQQLTPDAIDFAESQYGLAHYLAHCTDDQASDGRQNKIQTPSPGIALVGNYAMDLANSVDSFLEGVAKGTYKGLEGTAINVAQATKAIYNNPVLLADVSTHIMNAITDPSGMIDSAKDAFAYYYTTLATGTSGERGLATGQLLSDVFAVVAVQEIFPVQIVVGSVVENITGAGIAEPLGEEVVQKAESSSALAKDVKTAEAIAQKVVDASAENIGELKSVVRLLRESDASLIERRDVITSFTKDTQVVTTTDDEPVIRYWKEGESFPRSHWVTPEPAADPHSNLALPYPGPYNLQKWTLPKGTEVIKGLVNPKYGMPGGGKQIYVPNPGVLK